MENKDSKASPTETPKVNPNIVIQPKPQTLPLSDSKVGLLKI